MIRDSFINRIKMKARANQLCIAVGSFFSVGMDLPTIASEICMEFNVKFSVSHKYEWFSKWNEFIGIAEAAVSRKEILNFVRKKKESTRPHPIHRKLASIPISNFVDVSLDRQLLTALKEHGKQPFPHSFSGGTMMGAWKQRNPDSPNVFTAFIELQMDSHWYGLHQQLTNHPQDRIQIENMMEMVRQKDLLILGMSAFEAEDILCLAYLSQAADKVVNSEDPTNSYQYWTKRGTYLAELPTEAVINELVPYDMKSYSFMDAPYPGRMMIDIMKKKEFDVFISYFSGDQDFARKIAGDLQNRDLHVWRDEGEIDIGDSISDKIQEALKRCFTFVIILSPEALKRPWVKEELRAAYNLRLAEELKILPVVYRDCELPIFLSDYRFADFREEKNYTEQMEILSRSISNSVKKAREKK
jgi:hypothetical protein